MTSEANNCVIVLGMHRSGTSALAGCLNIMGVNLGRSMMPGNQANQAGYFENQDIVLAHDILLRDLGCRWDMMGNLPEDWENTPAADKAMETLTGILERQLLSNSEPFAIKDPRLCRLMPLWNNVLSSLNIHPSFILMVRHPMETAGSLKKRDGFDLLKGHLLWMVHNREALQACRGSEHTIITFDQLLADPVHTLGKACSIEPLNDLNSRSYTQDILEFIRPELKHHHQGSSTEIKDKLFAHYAWVYDQFRNLQARVNITRLESGPGRGGTTLPMAEELSDFPMAFPVSSVQGSSSGRTHAAGIFNNLMDIIGRFEQADLDQSIKRKRLLLASANAAETIYAQVYFPDPACSEQPYTEQSSHKFLLAPGEWQTLSLDIPDPQALRRAGLRIDPLNTRGMAAISNIKLINIISGNQVWTAQNDFSRCSVEGDCFSLSTGESLEIICTGNDPRIILPQIPDLPDTPLRMELWIKANRSQGRLNQYWEDLQKQIHQLNQQKNELKQKNDQLVKLQNSLEKKSSELELAQKALTKQEDLTREYHSLLTQAEQNHEKVKLDLSKVRKAISNLEEQLSKKDELTREYYNALAKADEEHDQALNELEQVKLRLDEQKNKYGRLQKEHDQALNELSDKKALISQKDNLSRKYARALAKAEEEQEIFRERSKHLHAGNKQLIAWMHRLQKNHDALMNSARWKAGNKIIRFIEIFMLRGKKTLASDEMDKIFRQFQARDDLLKTSTPEKYLNKFEQAPQEMLSWIRQLSMDLKALKKSLRWKTGNFLVYPVELVTFRAGKTKAVDNLEKIFQAHEAELKSSPDGVDLKQLKKRLRVVSKDFKALQKSMRWKVGDGIFSLVDRVLLRGKKTTAMDHALQVIEKIKEREE